MTRAQAADLGALVDYAHHLADLSGAAILPHFRKTIAVRNKASAGGFDPVTAADRAAERVLRKAIAARYPEHGIIGEEYAQVASKGRLSWVLDPIDGTRAFITGMPLWGTLIGLLDADAAVLGLMDQPYTQERFWGAAGKTHCRAADGTQRRLKSRGCAGLGDAVLMSTHPDLFKTPAERAAFEQIKTRSRMSRFGGDCYAYCMLAAGFVDLVVEAGLKTYDVVALIPIIEGAGGRITTWEGKPATGGGRIIAAGDARVHKEALAILRTVA